VLEFPARFSDDMDRHSPRTGVTKILQTNNGAHVDLKVDESRTFDVDCDPLGGGL